MALGQKEAVVKAVKHHLPNFVPYKDIALVMLSASQLEEIKAAIVLAIENKVVEYSKDPTNRGEVVPYARSMVMNHLKKARELNGNQIYGGVAAQTKPAKVSKALAGIDQNILPEDLKAFVETLV